MAYIGYIYRFRNAKNGKSYIGKTNNPKRGFVWKYKEGGEYAS